MHVNSKFVE